MKGFFGDNFNQLNCAGLQLKCVNDVTLSRNYVTFKYLNVRNFAA